MPGDLTGTTGNECSIGTVVIIPDLLHDRVYFGDRLLVFLPKALLRAYIQEHHNLFRKMLPKYSEYSMNLKSGGRAPFSRPQKKAPPSGCLVGRRTTLESCWR